MYEFTLFFFVSFVSIWNSLVNQQSEISNYRNFFRRMSHVDGRSSINFSSVHQQVSVNTVCSTTQLLTYNVNSIQLDRIELQNETMDSDGGIMAQLLCCCHLNRNAIAS